MTIVDTFDPHAPSFYQDPFPTYAQLRESAAVARVPGEAELWFVTTWDLIREALKDPQTYSSRLPPARNDVPPPEIADEVAALRAQGFPYTPALGQSDAPIHTRYRRMVNRAFTPRSLTAMEPHIAAVARELADGLPDGEVVDAMESFTIPLPVWAIMRILGVSDQYRRELREWSDAATASLGAKVTPERWLDIERSMLQFQQVMCEHLDARRAEPRDDLLSVLVAPDEDGSALGNGELVWLVRELIVAGNETTVRALAAMISDIDVLRADDPAVWDRVRDDERFRTGLIEESIRMSSPVMGLFRVTTTETQLGGETIPAGATVFLAYGSANRDDAVFGDPDTLDPLRENVRSHLAFGHGIHVCVGAGLARLESAIALTTLAERFRALEVVDPAALRFDASYALRGFTGLPVRVVRR